MSAPNDENGALNGDDGGDHQQLLNDILQAYVQFLEMSPQLKDNSNPEAFIQFLEQFRRSLQGLPNELSHEIDERHTDPNNAESTQELVLRELRALNKRIIDLESGFNEQIEAMRYNIEIIIRLGLEHETRHYDDDLDWTLPTS